LFQIDFWKCQTLQHLIRVCPNPDLLLSLSPEQLVQAFRAQNCRLGQISCQDHIPGSTSALTRSRIGHHPLRTPTA
jgi:hypothetical protein